MKNITDEFLKEMMTKARKYMAVILKKAVGYTGPDARQVIWNMAAGILP